MSGYATINGASKELTAGFATIGGAWKKLSKGWVTKDGVWKQILSSRLPLSSLPEGSLVAINESHTSQADWPPESTPAIWTVIDESHAGTIDYPIPAARGMEYEYGKYYLDPEDGKTYLCKRGEETGSIVLYYLPHELIGQYFEEVS